MHACIHCELIYTTDHIFPVLPIKHLENQDGKPTTTHKLATSIKPSVSNLRVLFPPHVVKKATTHIDAKLLNMCHQSQTTFWGIFFGITQHQKGHLIHVHITRKIVSSHDIVFDKKNSCTLAYTSHMYSEALATRPEVSHIVYTTSSHEQTGNIITFEQFEEGGLM